MDKFGKWIAGAVGGLIALGGLFMASYATSAGFYYAGLVVCLVGLIYGFYQLKRGLDQMEAQQRAQAGGQAASGKARGKGAGAKSSSGAGTRATSGTSQRTGQKTGQNTGQNTGQKTKSTSA